MCVYALGCSMMCGWCRWHRHHRPLLTHTHTVTEIADPHTIHTALAALLTSTLNLSLYFWPPLLEFHRGNCLDPLPSTSFLSIAPQNGAEGRCSTEGWVFLSGDSVDTLILQYAIYLNVVFILTVDFNKVAFNKTDFFIDFYKRDWVEVKDFFFRIYWD